jgi:glutamate synthase (NADPH/NADH) small chain
MSRKPLSKTQAMLMASRCLMCEDASCTCDCPAGVDARAFIRKIRFDNLDGAVRMLKQCNVLAASCSYICPTGALCTKECKAEGLTGPIDIGGLQRFVCDYERRVGMIEPVRSKCDGAKVAIVGAGPAGLGCAAELACRNYAVTVFERESKAGGMLRQCIPSYRLPEEVLDFEEEFIRKLGVEFVFGNEVDDPKAILKKGFDAVFIAAGLSSPKGMDVPGSDLPGVYQALNVLKAAKHGTPMDLGKRAIVIGGGDTALDAARIAKKSGSECLLLYRRTQKEMPAYKEEISAAWDEGIEFYFRTVVHSISGSNKVTGVRCVRVHWRDKIPGRQQAFDVEGTQFQVACDSVIIAAGQCPASTFGLRTTPNGMIAVDKAAFATSEQRIFAAGDIVNGGTTAAQALGMGKKAAENMDRYLKAL